MEMLFLFNEISYSEILPSMKIYRSSHRRCSVRKGVPRNLAKRSGKHLCHGLFFNKVAGCVTPHMMTI